MLEPVFSLLQPYSPDDLLAYVAALQLCPENADHLIRLEALTHCVTCLPYIVDRPKITRHRLMQICNEPPLAKGIIQQQEDPTINLITESFSFFKGAYIVFPGIVEDATFILKSLYQAIFFNSEFDVYVEFRNRAYGLSLAILALSNDLAIRAGMSRNIAPITKSNQIYIPNDLERKRAAVHYRNDEIQSLLNRYGLPIDVLDPFIQEFNEFTLEDYSFQNTPLHAKPLTRTADGLIIASPCILLAALRYQILLTAKSFCLLPLLSDTYQKAVTSYVGKALSLFNHEQLPAVLSEIDPCLRVQQSLWTLDTDKVMYVVVWTDNFVDYVGDNVFEDCDNSGVGNLLDAHLAKVEEKIYTDIEGLNEIFILLINCGVGRTHILGLNLPEVKSAPVFLMMSASELEILSLLYAHNSTLLYKFAQAFTPLLDNKKLFAWSTLDAFGIYRRGNYSFYLSDNEPPPLMIPRVGSEVELRVEALQKNDIHTVPYYSPGSFLEVVNLYQTPEIPVYFPLSSILHRIELFVEIEPFPIWVIVNPKLLENKERTHPYPNCGLWADMIAYWLWQFEPELKKCISGVNTERPLLIEIDLANDENWRLESLPSDDENVAPLICEQVPDQFKIKAIFFPQVLPILDRVDNFGEMVCMQIILQGIASLLEVLDLRIAGEQVRANASLVIACQAAG